MFLVLYQQSTFLFIVLKLIVLVVDSAKVKTTDLAEILGWEEHLWSLMTLNISTSRLLIINVRACNFRQQSSVSKCL